MADLSRIKRNVRKMVEAGAPEADIDSYISGEGVRLEDVKAFSEKATTVQSPLTTGPTEQDLASANDLAGSARTAAGGFIEGIPIIGPPIRRGVEMAAAATLAPFSDKSFGDIMGDIDRENVAEKQVNPIIDVGSQIAGGIASLGAVGGTALGGRALGITGPNLLSRAGASAASGAAISGLDTIARGKADGQQVATNAAIGGALGGAIPLVGAGIRAGGRAIGRRVGPTIRGLRNPKEEANRAVSTAINRDAANVAAPTISAADEATARLNAQPLLNVDRGGETTRALMRSAANQNPEARAVVEKLAQDRFRSQSNRTVGFFNRIMGGEVDEIARTAQIRSQARAVNSPAYRAAYQSPNAQQVWNRDLQELMQSDAVQTAISQVGSRSSNRAAVAGVRPVRNPFRKTQDGRWNIVQKADGTTAVPTLEFWDQVKRNLDGMIDQSHRGANPDRMLASDLAAVKAKLVGTLDNLVPEYSTARSGAAAFFGAEDALDAGRKAFAAPKNIDESLIAFNKMSKADKKDFAIGMVSRLMDDVRSVNNRTNLTRMFDIPARKELLKAALGPQKTKQFEGFVRVEDIMDQVRGALGNSTTARQLMELGIVNELKQTGGQSGIAGVTTFAATGSLGVAGTMALLTAAGRAGTQALRSKADAQVLKKVAELLASGSKSDLDKAITSAMISPKHMNALKAIQFGLGISARTGANQITRQNSGGGGF